MDRKRKALLRSTLCLGTSVGALMIGASAHATAQENAAAIDIPPQPVATALRSLATETGANVLFTPDAVSGKQASGVTGHMSPEEAARRLVAGTGLQVVNQNGAIVVRVAQTTAPKRGPAPLPAGPASVETVVVTAQKKSENIQQVPIAVTALSQAQLTDRQIAAGPDLIRDVPNMNFGKTNFAGYSIELRGIGTQAISVTTDPAVAVAYNGIPFIRNHFFEQEFFDLNNVEVLRGPQGTLYGRNATAGVVNLIPALPTDQFEAMASVDIGNYMNRRLEGMINLPIADDKLDIRVAGEWTKRDGYTLDTTLGQDVDGRDLWSGRVTIGFKPSEDLQAYLVWEHFSEDDNRLRSGKQLCKTSNPPASVNGVPVPPIGSDTSFGGAFDPASYLSQGCEAASLYSSQSFEVPDGYSLPYIKAAKLTGQLDPTLDPYAETTQSTNLRSIQSTVQPQYRAKNDIVELNANYRLTSALTLTSQTGYNDDSLFSTEDYNRFDTSPGLFIPNSGTHPGEISSTGVFCDPQVGCSDRLVALDESEETAWQFSQELRLASNFSGPLNFNVGGNFLHYETEENYYVFINALTMYTLGSFGNGVEYTPYVPGVSDNHQCLYYYGYNYRPLNPQTHVSTPSQSQCNYIDPNPIGSLNNMGHNYFLSQNPYMLNSYAAFGEAYYNILPNLKLTTGLRFTEDQKTFDDIPSELLTDGWGYFQTGTVNQKWDRLTGRAVLDWSPELSFTDQTLIYGSYAHGYKAGGANPPGAALIGDATGNINFPDHPLTFKPEYIEAFELGTKNTLLGGSLTLNGDVFYYNYTGYQISEIVDRTAINNNYNAHVEGAEIESNWEPLPGLKFNFAGGWEDTAAARGDSGIDLMDRTGGVPGWMVVKPYPTQASNCILPTYVVATILNEAQSNASSADVTLAEACGTAYNAHLDPATQLAYTPNPTTTAGNDGQGPQPVPPGYIGFNPLTAPNNGEGFSKNLSGHALPNAPPFTVSFGSQYTMPILDDWAATLRGDFYWQADSWARIFNDNPYDRLQGYTNLNLALILTSDDGWQIMGYVKNVFNTTAITGDFLNSDDSGLTTNVFLTDPRLYGIRITKNFGEGDTGAMAEIENYIADLFGDADKTKPALWITLGGQLEQQTGQGDSYDPPFVSNYPLSLAYKPESPLTAQKPPLFSEGEEASIKFQPEGSDWVVAAAVRYGRANRTRNYSQQTQHQVHGNYPYFVYYPTPSGGQSYKRHCCHAYTHERSGEYLSAQNSNSTSHTIIDFQAGQDVGLGSMGIDSQSVLSGGLRIAQFMSRSSTTLHAQPDAQVYNSANSFILNRFPGAYYPQSRFHVFAGSAQSKRSFHGVGPSVSWNASLPVLSAGESQSLSVDWGANGALLFGRRRAAGQHHESGHYHAFHYCSSHGGTRGNCAYYSKSASFNRRKNVVVPNLGGFAGISVNYQNAKVSLGYRGDFFFGAMDTGWDKAHSNNVAFLGPFANLSIGF